MNNCEVVYICQPPRIFSLQEAQSIVPYLETVTRRHETAVQKLISRQHKLVKCGAPMHVIDELQKEVNDHMKRWGAKIYKLGAIPLTGGAVGIDAGGYYWSWFLGERKIEHYHLYVEDPKYRRHLSVKI